MSLKLKVNNGATIQLGPFVNATDGVTPETGLAGTMTVYLSKNNGAFAARNDATAITHDRDGWYLVPLNSTDINTAGNLIVMVEDAATHLPVWREIEVITNDIYETMYSGTVLPVDVFSIKGSGTNATNISNFFSGTGYNAGNSSIGSVSTVNTVTTVATVNALSSAADNAIRDAVAGKVVEAQGSYTLQQALSIILAAVAGVTDDAGATIKTPNGSATRISATLSSNERTAMTLTPSS